MEDKGWRGLSLPLGCSILTAVRSRFEGVTEDKGVERTAEVTTYKGAWHPTLLMVYRGKGVGATGEWNTHTLSTKIETPKAHGCCQGLEAPELSLAMGAKAIRAGDAKGWEDRTSCPSGKYPV